MKTIQDIHSEAAQLIKEWYPDTVKYPREKRTAELALMAMMIALEFKL